MKITAKYCLVVKDGSPPEHNDDAAAADELRGRFAISDGATESGFSRVWSKILTDEFVRCSSPPDDFQSWLPTAQQRWLDELREVKIPWYGERQFELGAFATMLGVILQSAEKTCSWQAVAIGDSCLFQVRENTLIQSFPLDQSADFNSTPRLLGSRTPGDTLLAGRALFASGQLLENDRLFLLSDAIAKWCLAENELGRNPWQELDEIMDTPDASTSIATWVSNARDRRGLHNDDVTIMTIACHETKTPHP